MEQFKYWGTTSTYQNSIHEEIKSRLKSGNACHHLVQNLSSFRLPSKNTNTEIYRTMSLPVLLFGRKTWTITLRDKSRLRVFENRIQRRIFGPKRDEITRQWRKLDNEELNDLYSSPNIVREELDGRDTWSIWDRREVPTGFWWGKLRERDLLEDPNVSRRIILRWIFRKWNGRGGTYWIVLAQNRWQVAGSLCAVMNRRVSTKCG